MVRAAICAPRSLACASRAWAWAFRRASASRGSVMSRVTWVKPVTRPPESKLAVSTTLARKRLPSLRIRQAS